MTPETVRKILRKACGKAGGQRTWAAAVSISPPHVNDVLHGRREPGPAICRALGVERVVTYRRVAVAPRDQMEG